MNNIVPIKLQYYPKTHTDFSFFTETNKKCLEFSKLNAMNSIKDLFIPKLKISLMMYSRNNSNCAEPLFGSNNSLNARFNLSKKTVWIIHGFRPLGSTPAWLSKFTETFLKMEDVNLIVVDWNHGATTFLYSRAVKNTRMVAASLSVSIQNLLVSMKLLKYTCYTIYELLCDITKLILFP